MIIRSSKDCRAGEAKISAHRPAEKQKKEHLKTRPAYLVQQKNHGG